MRADTSAYARRYHRTHTDLGARAIDRALDQIADYRAAKRIVRTCIEGGVSLAALQQAIDQAEMEGHR